MTEDKRGLETQIQEDLFINEADILEDLRRHSAKFYYYGVLWAKAARAKRKQRLRMKELEAALSNNLRKEIVATDAKDKRVTEAMRNDYFHSNPDFLEAEQSLIHTEYMEEVLDVTRDAMKQRGMALQELAKHEREEQMYGAEFGAMKKEFEERVEDVKKEKRHRRTKAEMEMAKQVDHSEDIPH